MAISEKVQLLGTYTNIPKVVTISSINTEDELRYVGDESYIDLMLNDMFPKLIVEDIDYDSLLEIDFHWLCRCIRILSFGPIHSTNSIFCDNCHKTTYGEYKVNLNTVACKPIPKDAPSIYMVNRSEFLEFESDVFFKLLTIAEANKMSQDDTFIRRNGKVDVIVGRLCYMITAIGDRDNLKPYDVYHILKNEISSADYQLLRAVITSMSDYGLRSGGKARCPKCHSNEAAFIALQDDRYYVRPWEIHGNGYTVSVGGVDRTYREVRQTMYENVIDEALFIARASESAVSADWIMTQPILIRKKYVDSFTKELQERERKMNKGKKGPHNK